MATRKQRNGNKLRDLRLNIIIKVGNKAIITHGVAYRLKT